MGAVTYPNPEVGEFIQKYFIPLQLLFDAKPLAKDFQIKWTPSILTLDGGGKEHHRTVGFLAPEEFIPSLMLGLAKTRFDLDQFDEALVHLDQIIAKYPKSGSAPEAVYLRGVARYKSTHDAKKLKEAFEQLKESYPTSEWAQRAAPYRLL
jgi:tetratricopeptide (TPR) repeat protein